MMFLLGVLVIIHVLTSLFFFVLAKAFGPLWLAMLVFILWPVIVPFVIVVGLLDRWRNR